MQAHRCLLSSVFVVVAQKKTKARRSGCQCLANVDRISCGHVERGVGARQGGGWGGRSSSLADDWWAEGKGGKG